MPRKNNKTCKICGERVSRNTLSLVCRKCYYESLQGSGNPNYGNRYAKEYLCLDCGCEINHGYQRCHVCAAKQIWVVSYKIKQRDFRGTKNPNYIDGKGSFPYPMAFSEELKKKIRSRDNYICQNCGMSEEEHLIVYGQNLHVHHIDYNKHNCNEDNLITVCNPCNTRANYNRDYWQSKYAAKFLKEVSEYGTVQDK